VADYFPVDDVTLVMLAASCLIAEGDDRTHLHDFLSMGAREKSRTLLNEDEVEDGGTPIYEVEHEEGYGIFTEHDAILALVAEVQRLRASTTTPPASPDPALVAAEARVARLTTALRELEHVARRNVLGEYAPGISIPSSADIQALRVGCNAARAALAGEVPDAGS